MARADIEVKFSEYRPCIVGGRKALFHRLADKAQTVGESLLRGGHAGGQLWGVFAIVEYEDGTMSECYISEVRFLDSKGMFAEYDFTDKETDYNA